MPANLRFELATPASESQLRSLLRRNPLSGNIEVALEREPNAFHAAGISGDDCQLILAFESGERDPIGAGARYELEAHVNGRVRRIGYLGELRSHVGFKYRRTLLLEAYRELRRHHRAGTVSYYLTTIVEDNTAARRLLEAGLADMPTYEPIGTMATLTIPVKSGCAVRARPLRIDPAAAEDIRPIADALNGFGRQYQFHPLWSERALQSGDRCRELSPQDFLVCRDGNGMRGFLALWDQRSFKQTVIRGYSAKLARLRPLYNLVAPLLRRPRLPDPGANLESTFLSHVMVQQDDADTLIALIRRACRNARQRGLDYIMIGLAERHPFYSVVRKRFSSHCYRSMAYVVYWDDGRDEAAKLDGRILFPEMAIL